MNGFAKLWFRWPHLPTPEHHLLKSSNNPNPGHRKFPPSTPTCQVYGPRTEPGTILTPHHCSVSPSQGCFLEPRSCSESWACPSMGLSEGQHCLTSPLWALRPLWPEILHMLNGGPPAWVKPPQKKEGSLSLSGVCPHSLLLAWDTDERLGRQQPPLDHEERAKTPALMGLCLAQSSPFVPYSETGHVLLWPLMLRV